MKRQKFATIAGLLLAGSGLMAQTGGGIGGGGGGGGRGGAGAYTVVPMEFQSAGSFGTVTARATATLTASSASGPLAVTGKPVSATEERKSVQTLGDGTEISNSESNLFYRDGQGRVRLEQVWQGRTVIAIMDPVARFVVRLDPERKTANKSAINEAFNLGGISISGGSVSQSFGVKSEGRSSTASSTESRSVVAGGFGGRGGGGAGGGSGAGSGGGYVASGGGGGTSSVSTTSGGGGGGGVAMAGGRGGARGGTPALPTNNKFTNDDLGVRSLNGVLATGTRATMTIPQGQIGNNRDIHVVNERWFSEDLQMLVKSVNSDPRFGDTTYELTNISRGEPDPTLFQIPADYRVSEGQQGGSFQVVPRTTTPPVIK